ncbi:MAG TPA: hypothetical protein VK034_23455, partial [Enhygromyxa sp.]|nr:hypothetical protein [Enhygromyxa sp.]
DPRGGSTSAAVGRSCPRKYLVDGSTGLGLASRFPGHTQVIGRDRARLARTLSWPSGDATRDRRALALESGLWLLAIVIGGWALGRVRRPSEATRPAAAAISIVTVGLLVLALLVSPGEAAIDRGGPTLLAILLVLVPARPSTPTRREVEPAALPCALLLALLAASPLAGRGDAVELLAITREGLVELGLGWSLASALAGSLATLALMIGAVTIGAVISTATRPDPSEPCGDRSPNTAARIRERRHEWIGLGLALACGVGLALRKPVDDLPLLQGAGALLVLASIRLRSPVQQLALTLACTALAAAPLLDGDARSPVAVGLVGLMALVCLGVGLAAARRAGSTEAPTHG